MNMLSYRQFIEEQRKAGKLSSILATLALAIHGGKQLYHNITDPNHIQRHWNHVYNPSLETHVTPEEIANFFKDRHAHEVKNKKQEEENENIETPTRRP